MTTILKMPSAILPLSGTEMMEIVQNGKNPLSSLPGGTGGGTQGTAGSQGVTGTQGTTGTQGSTGTQATTAIR